MEQLTHSYEKAYNEALDRARKFMCQHPTRAEADLMVALFPELAESEEERILKEIISALKFLNDGGVYDKHIAYIEKQKEQNVEPFSCSHENGISPSNKLSDDEKTLREIEEFLLYKSGYLLDADTENRFITYLGKLKK